MLLVALSALTLGPASTTVHAVTPSTPIVSWLDNPGPLTVSGRSHVFDVQASDPNNVSIDKWCLTLASSNPSSPWTWTHSNIASADANGFSFSDLLPSNGYVTFDTSTACWTRSVSTPKPGIFGLTDIALQPDTTAWPDGTYTATITATNANNESASATLSFTTSNAAPTVSWVDVVNPSAANSVQGMTTLSVDAEHDPAGTAKLSTWCLKRDGVIQSTNLGSARPDNTYADLLFNGTRATFDGETGCWSPSSNDIELTRGSFTFDATYWSDGSHTLQLTVSDTSGRSTSSTINLSSLHQAPTVSFDFPAPGITAASTALFEAIVTNDAGGTATITSWCVLIDGRPVTTNISTDIYRYRFLRRNGTFHAANGCWTSPITSLDAGAFTIDTYQLVNGMHTVRIVATDSTGRRGYADLLFLSSNQFPALQVSSGNTHSCAVLYDHEVSCTGLNTNGQLGQLLGTNTVFWTPVPGLRGVSSVSAGGDFTCAVKSPGATGTAVCWGGNASGQLGDFTTVAHASPSTVRRLGGGALTGVSQISAGSNATCAVVSPGVKGQVWCWGNNKKRQLGDGTTTNRSGAVRVMQSAGVALTGAVSVSVGSDSACAVMSTQRVQCWGSNQYGQLGISNTSTQVYPSFVHRIDGHFSKARSVTVGAGFVCARFGDDSAWCWGRNDRGQLGSGNLRLLTAPNPVLIDSATRLGRIVSISAGTSHACAVMKQSAASSVVYCWGDNRSAQLANGLALFRQWATLTRSLPSDFTPTSVACGSYQTLALGRSTAAPAQPVVGWGRNSDGQLGLGAASAPVGTPTPLTDLNGV